MAYATKTVRYKRRVRPERRAAGLCIWCSGPVEPGFKKCLDCRARAAKANREWRDRRRIERLYRQALIEDGDPVRYEWPSFSRERAPEPAIALWHELAQARKRGEAFGQAWYPALLAAVAGLSDEDEQTAWVRLLSEIVDSWHAAYERRSSLPNGRTSVPELLDLSLLDDVMPAQRPRFELIA
jgi:hypothetical protein